MLIILTPSNVNICKINDLLSLYLHYKCIYAIIYGYMQLYSYIRLYTTAICRFMQLYTVIYYGYMRLYKIS